LAKAAPDAANASSCQALPANICMVGAGNMGGAMVRGWITSGGVDPERTSVCTRREDKARQWHQHGVAEVSLLLSEFTPTVLAV
jgi:pyrroline-5-carboxylate reductase